MSKENVEIVRKMYEAFNRALAQENVEIARGDMDALLDFWDPEFELHDFADSPVVLGEVRGPEVWVRWIEQVTDAAEIQFQPEQLIEAGDRVVIPLRMLARGKISGVRTEFDLVVVSTLRNGRIARSEVYRDRAQALEAVGLQE